MGEITNQIFEGMANRGERRNVARRAKTVQQQKDLEDRKRAFAAETAEADSEVLECDDEAELEQRLDAYLDARRIGAAASGQSGAQREDAVIAQLDAELGFYQRNWSSLKTQAIAAQRRLSGTATRAAGYDSPVDEGRASSKGPVLLAIGVGLVEWAQTAAWLDSNLSLWEASLGGNSRAAIVIGGSGILTAIVMAITFLAGRKLKQGVVARRASAADGVGSGKGGELGLGIAMALIAAAFQTVTLSLRFSTESGDETAQAGALVVGLISFFGAFAVALWEYASFTPSATHGTAVYTRHADAAKVDEFRQAEYRRYSGIPLDKRELEIEALRIREEGLQRLQPAALQKGPVQVRVLNSKLSDARQRIVDLREKSFDYVAADLDSVGYSAIGSDDGA